MAREEERSAAYRKGVYHASLHKPMDKTPYRGGELELLLAYMEGYNNKNQEKAVVKGGDRG